MECKGLEPKAQGGGAPGLPDPGTHAPEGVPGVGPTPGLTHSPAGPGYTLIVSPG